MTWRTRLLAGIALPSLVGAGLAYRLFVQPAPARSGTGVITAKVFVPADTWTRRTMTPRGPTVAERRVPLPTRYRFTIAVAVEPRPLRYTLDSARARAFTVGQRVRVTYERHGLPLLWERAYVTEMHAAEPP